MNKFTLLFGALLSVSTIAWLTTAMAEEQKGSKPVEDSMHEFMEYVFEPNYKRLRVIMKTEPTDNKGWKPIKGDALALAEATNLLFDRLPDENEQQWKEMTADTRDKGAAFYQAAKQRNWENAVETYQAMLTSCNKCHKDFADGKYQLKPFLEVK